MSVRMRHTRGHTNNRRSHHALDGVKAVSGEKAGTLRLPHRVDEITGTYRGRQIAPAAKPRKTAAQTHDHPHGTHHEHVIRHEFDEPKPEEAKQAEEVTKETGAKPRSPRGSKKDPGN